MPKIKYSREEVLNYIIAYKTANDGNSPTMREIMRACRVSSTSLVSYILRDLQDAKKIRVVDGSRGIMVTGGSWKVEEKNGNS